MFISVDFPLPDAPRIDTNSPRSTCSDTEVGLQVGAGKGIVPVEILDLSKQIDRIFIGKAIHRHKISSRGYGKLRLRLKPVWERKRQILPGKIFFQARAFFRPLQLMDPAAVGPFQLFQLVGGHLIAALYRLRIAKLVPHHHTGGLGQRDSQLCGFVLHVIPPIPYLLELILKKLRTSFDAIECKKQALFLHIFSSEKNKQKKRCKI